MQGKRLFRGDVLRVISIAVGIALSVILSYIAFYFKLPIYPDAIGSIGVSFLCGIFPGILAAVLTDAVSMIFNADALYFTIVNVIGAIYSAWFIRKKGFREVRNIFIFIVSAGIIGGVLSGLIQWGIFSEPQNADLSVWLDNVFPEPGISRISLFLFINTLINILEKTVSVGIILPILHLIPDKQKERIRNSGWRQRPLTVEQITRMDTKRSYTGVSIRQQMTLMIAVMSFSVAVIVGGTGLRLYGKNARAEFRKSAYDTAKAASNIIDADRIRDYMQEGRDAKGYKETEDLLYYIWKSASDVEYLYVLTIDDDYVTFVFDVEDRENEDEIMPFEPGEKVPVEDAFRPYMPALLAGEEIEPVESDGAWDWLVTAYYPVRNNEGKTVCYVGADASLNYFAGYMEDFSFRVLLIIAGFLALIIAYGLWISGIYYVYPLESMTETIGGLIEAGTDQKKLDAAVKNIRKLDISTGGELEDLYREICDMASNQAEQLRSVRKLADSTARMQDGLIIIMADMVENRDSDTGAHVQKTAAYVNIIAEGLKRKGYYPEKLTEKFMSDVVRSAPLHDVGKINISDEVLNKPGKLTDEEFEIMKTHTIAGRQIIENAISTMEGDSYLKEARNMAGYHHERWDGKGYPEGLHGEVIPLSARIMAVADVFDALTSPRVYKPAFPLEKALSIIEEGKGTQFDPKCVEVFMESLDDVKVILKKFNG